MPGFVERQIATLIANLADEKERADAMHTLKGYGPRVIPFLIDVLGDPSRMAYATIVLSEIGEPAITALLDVLGDDSKKYNASAALLEMGKKKTKTQKTIIPRLIDALADTNIRKRAMAGVTLLNFGAPTLEQHIPSLIDSLGSANAGAFAGNVLVGIGKPAVVPLMNAVSDESKKELVTNILQEIAKKDSTVRIPVAVSQKTKPVPSPTPNQSLRPKFCKYCGASLTPDSVYCPQCGRKIE